MRSLTGWQRLGVVLAVSWISAAISVYFVALQSYGSSQLALKLGFLFSWVTNPAESKPEFESLKPVFNAARFAALVLGPIFLMWLAARAVVWVRTGFHQDGKAPSSS